MANKPLQSIKFPGLSDTYVVPQIDNTMTQAGQAADSKAVGDKISEVKSELNADQNILFEHLFVKTGIITPTVNTGMLKKDGTIGDTVTSYSIASFTAEANKVYCIRGLSSGSRYSEIRLIDVGESGYIVPQKNATFMRYIANYAGTVMICYRNNVTPVIEVGASYVPVNPANLADELTSVYNQINPLKTVSDYDVDDALAWEIGSINASTGANMNSSTRIRTVDYIDLIGVSDVKITIGNGYKYCLYWYKSDKTLQSYTSFYTTDHDFAIPADAMFLRILVADTLDGTASTTYAHQITISECYAVVKSVNKLAYGFDNSDMLLAEKATVSTLMSIRYGAKTAIAEIKLVSGKSYSVTVTPVTPIDLNSSDNSINPIIYDSEMTAKIRLGKVSTTDNVFSEPYTAVFTATEDINNAVLGAYIVLPAIADYKIAFEIKEITINNLVYDVDGLKHNNLMPIYYKAYMAERIETIRTLDAEIGNTGDAFIFATDLHETNAYNSPLLIKYIINNSAVGNLFYGGDYINQPASKALAIETLQNNIAKLRISERAVFLRGNHETNPYGTGQLTAGEVYGIINKRIERYVDTDAKNYYYIDNKSQKIRYIVLDTGEDGDIDATQEVWVNATASELETGWTIILLSHMAIYASGKDVRDNIQKYDVVDKVLTALSGISAKVACWVCGHTHKDLAYATANFPIICTTCDANGNQSSTYTSDNRDAGTVNEQAFDVFHVDTDSKTVYATRIGGGQYNVIATGDLTDNDRQWAYT